jgi:hypothetical protein
VVPKVVEELHVLRVLVIHPLSLSVLVPALGEHCGRHPEDGQREEQGKTTAATRHQNLRGTRGRILYRMHTRG